MLTLGPKRLPRVTPEVCGWLLVATQALLLPVLAIVRQSLLYDDLPALLFACPAAALLLTAGWKKFVADLGRESTTTRSVLGLVWSTGPARTHGRPDPVVPVCILLRGSPGRGGRELRSRTTGAAYRFVSSAAGSGGRVRDLPSVAVSAWGDAARSPPTGRPAAEASSDCRTDPMSTLTPYGLADEDPNRYVVDDTFLALFSRDAHRAATVRCWARSSGGGTWLGW